MAERDYQVRVLVADGKPGWIPFTYHVVAPTRDEAIKRVRKDVRSKAGSLHVKAIQSARLMQPGDRRVH